MWMGPDMVTLRIDAFARQQSQQRCWLGCDQAIDDELRFVCR
jgi:hypothetical protein